MPLDRKAWKAILAKMPRYHIGPASRFVKHALHIEKTFLDYQARCKRMGVEPLSLEELRDRSQRSMYSLLETIENAECEAVYRFQHGDNNQ